MKLSQSDRRRRGSKERNGSRAPAAASLCGDRMLQLSLVGLPDLVSGRILTDHSNEQDAISDQTQDQTKGQRNTEFSPPDP